MKYRLLTKEQFENLHEEFAIFLATQSIDAKEWKQLKKDKPEVAADEMAVFSDVVWDDVLKKVRYLEHFSKQSINLFHCDKTTIYRIFIKVNNDIDLLEKEGYEWLLSHTNNKAVELYTGSKTYTEDRNTELFDLIEKGSVIADGGLYEYFNKLT